MNNKEYIYYNLKGDNFPNYNKLSIFDKRSFDYILKCYNDSLIDYSNLLSVLSYRFLSNFYEKYLKISFDLIFYFSLLEYMGGVINV